ncbi:MAG: zinc metallopeptidase, partial [bacterium]
MLFWDPTFILLIPALILAFWAQAKVHSTYARYSRIQSAVGLSGSQVAKRILAFNGLNEVSVEPVAGSLSDHYDPRSRSVRLSEGNYGSPSVAA